MNASATNWALDESLAGGLKLRSQSSDKSHDKTAMTRPMIAVPYLVTMIAIIVALDVLIFRNHFWERLMVNVGIVLVFAAFYLRFFNRP